MKPAETVALGRSGVRVSRLGVGTAPFGGMYAHVEESAAVAVVHRALELGISYLDTAPQYGHGTAERRLGTALRARAPEAETSAARAEVVVSTKVGRLIVARPEADTHARPRIFADAPPSDAVFDFSRDGVLRSLEASLERLGLDRVDIVYLHDPDDHADEALANAYPVLHDLRGQGVVRAIGVGMNSPAIPARFVRETDLDVVLLAGRYTLLDRSGDEELLPLCGARGVSVVIGGVYNSGVLADPTPGARYDYAPAAAAVIERARLLGRICAEHAVPLKAAAIQFPFRHRAVSCVLTGARDVRELEENVAMLAVDVPEKLWTELDGALAEPAQ